MITMSNIGSSYIAIQSMGTMVIGVVIGIIGITGAFLAKETKNKLIWGGFGAIGLVVFWGGKKVKTMNEENPKGFGKYGLILFSLFVAERVFKMYRGSPTTTNNDGSNNDPESNSSNDSNNDVSNPVVVVPDQGPVPLPEASDNEIAPINPPQALPNNIMGMANTNQGNRILIP